MILVQTINNHQQNKSIMKTLKNLFLSFLVVFSITQISCNNDKELIDSFNWQISTPEEQNLDGSKLAQLSEKIIAGEYKEIHSLLIMRNGYLVFEEYYGGYSQNELHPIYSVTKSITSALIGITIDQDKINSLDQKLLSFLPEYSSISNMDSNKQKIKLENVLTMRAGFQWMK